jgi:hypothetical protein
MWSLKVQIKYIKLFILTLVLMDAKLGISLQGKNDGV